MEDKSIDQLRLEAQELYQAKLRAYNEAYKDVRKTPQKPKAAEREMVVEREIKPIASKEVHFNEVRTVPGNTPKNTSQTIPQTNTPQSMPQKASGVKNNWFVVSVFSILFMIVIMELFIF